MAETYGNIKFTYKYVDSWDSLPRGKSFLECPGVAVDSKDNVYVFTRGEHPIIVFNGNLYVTGRTSGNFYGNVNAGDSDVFLMKLSSSGTIQ